MTLYIVGLRHSLTFSHVGFIRVVDVPFRHAVVYFSLLTQIVYTLVTIDVASLIRGRAKKHGNPSGRWTQTLAEYRRLPIESRRYRTGYFYRIANYNLNRFLSGFSSFMSILGFYSFSLIGFFMVLIWPTRTYSFSAHLYERVPTQHAERIFLPPEWFLTHPQYSASRL